MDARLERKTLKNKLFTIRRFVEGDKTAVLNSELKRLKLQYEEHPNFTSWSDFPEKWDIGDPESVKSGSYMSNDVDKRNFSRTQGVPLSEIVSKEYVMKPEDKEKAKAKEEK